MWAFSVMGILVVVYVATSESGREAIKDIIAGRHPSLDWPHRDTRPAVARAKQILDELMSTSPQHHHPDADPIAALSERQWFPQLDAWQQWRWRRRCSREIGHCWHPADAFSSWACCECPATRDREPSTTCSACAVRRAAM